MAEPAKKEAKSLRDRFVTIAKKTSCVVGSVWAFMLAVLVVVVWGATGPLFHYSDTWQLVINTSTTIVTFLMVFLIQSTQNRDAQAVHLKLDELIHAAKGARDSMVDLESLSEDELKQLADEFSSIRERACSALKSKQHRAGKAKEDERETEAEPAEARR